MPPPLPLAALPAPCFALDGYRIAAGFDAIAVQLGAGEILHIRGLVPAQRDMLFAVLAVRRPPAFGRLRFEGRDLWALGESERRALRLRAFGRVLHEDALLPHLSLRENVAMPLLVNHVPHREAFLRADAELGELGLARCGELFPESLDFSAQRLALLARAVVHAPRVLVCEYPEHGMTADAVRAARHRLWRAAHEGHAGIALCTGHPGLASLAQTSLWPRREPELPAAEATLAAV